MFKISCRLISKNNSKLNVDALLLICELMIRNQTDTIRQIFLENQGLESLVNLMSHSDQIESRIFATRILASLLLSEDSIICEVT